MASLNVNGVTYDYPDTGDEEWGSAATNWASAVTSGMLQKQGGTFTLTSEVDFGAGFGLKSLYYKSRTANPASAGQVRLAYSDVINFRNSGNSANISWGLTSGVTLFEGATYKGYGLVDEYAALTFYSYNTSSSRIRSYWYNSDASKYFYSSARFDASSTPTGIEDHWTFGSDLVATLTITRAGQLAMAVSGAAAPEYSWATDLDTGIYHKSTNNIGFATNGTEKGYINATGEWNIGPTNGVNPHIINGLMTWNYSGAQYMSLSSSAELLVGKTDGSNGSVRIYGASLFLNYAGVAAKSSFIATNATSGLVSISGGNTLASSGDAGAVYYGSTHATKANYSEWYAGGTQMGSVRPAGVCVGTAAISTSATTGFLYLPSSAGSPVGTPTAITGLVPIEVDTTNGRLYAYYSGAWHYAAFT